MQKLNNDNDTIVRDSLMFRLYINTRSENSADIIQKINDLFKLNFKSGYKLEIIDIIKNFQKAINDNILASPTLIKLKPEPTVRIVGNILYDSLIQDLNIGNN